MPVCRVVLVGHSYINRLESYMNDNPDRFNLGLDPQRFSVECCGVSGGRAFGNHRTGIIYALGQSSVRNADVIFLHVGENDFGSPISSSSIAEQLYTLALHVTTRQRCRRVIINELFPFPAHRLEWSTETNRSLRQVAERNQVVAIRLWRQRRFDNQRAYARDGVHVAPNYMHQYWTSVRYAVLSGSR
jgi:hypothetical protein